MESTREPAAFKPYVPDDANLPELTVRALLLGSALGLVFGASSAYLGLRVGLTVSASIPIAVISITVFRYLSKILGSQASILENNVVQTTGSAGESIAGGVIFTVPALVFLGFELDWTRTMVMALMGGVLGVLMMIPLRRYLIVKEHGRLTYPEGTACAEVLMVGEEKGAEARLVFHGLFLGLLFKGLMVVTALWNQFPEKVLGFYHRTARVRLDASPELMGVGYIIGYRSSALMVGGGFLASFVLIPAIALFGEGRPTPLYPASTLISTMGADEIWGFYIRYIGAGAVAAGGIVNLVRAMPTIIDSFAASFRDLRLSRGASAERRPRTERDLPITVVLIGCATLALTMTLIPQLRVNLLAAVLIIVFGFFFAVVASRITGELGSSSCPISGMAIATLMGTCLLFLALGWTGHGYTAVALAVGGIVCIAASNAGTTSQDLKAGFLVGATPWKQQVALLVGVLTCVAVVGWTVIFINESFTTRRAAQYDTVLDVDPTAPTESGPDSVTYQLRRVGGVAGIPDGSYLADAQGRVHFEVVQGIGSEKAAAPQARLMSLVIKGILTQQLPWGLVLIGVFISILMEMVGVPALAFAVGVYLPLESTTPVFVGGLVRWLVDRRRGTDTESDAGPGVLYSSGLIAGGSLMGLGVAALAPERFQAAREWLAFGPRLLPRFLLEPGPSAAVGIVMFTGLAYLLHRAAVSSRAEARS